VTGRQDPAAPPRRIGRDRVFLDGLVRAIEVGIFPEEFGTLQKVRFTVSLEIEAVPGPAPEDVPQVSYLHIAEVIDELTVGRRTGLLETLAERLAARLLAIDAVALARIRIEKLDVLQGEASVGVECVRERAPSGPSAP